ncbi:hypothetical protein, partial [Streptococcus pneumoniae]
MSKLTKEDVLQVSQDIINDAIPVIKDMLDEVFEKYPIDIEIREAIFYSVLVAHKLSTETTVSLLTQLVNAQENWCFLESFLPIQGLPSQRWTLFSHYTDIVLVSFSYSSNLSY